MSTIWSWYTDGSKPHFPSHNIPTGRQTLVPGGLFVGVCAGAVGAGVAAGVGVAAVGGVGGAGGYLCCCK